MAKTVKRTAAQRRAAAKAAKAVWARRRALAADNPNDARIVAAVNEGDTNVIYHLNAAGYDALAAELSEAFAQSAYGKGKERHARGRPFDRQPILELGRLYGPGFSTGQAAKKAQEALGMLSRGERDKSIHELHGAIVYLAAAASLIREGGTGAG